MDGNKRNERRKRMRMRMVRGKDKYNWMYQDKWKKTEKVN